MARVSLRQVSRRYGAATALHPTDLDVAEGEFLTLLGASGCGKTTTLRIVAGFVPPDTGRVWIGEDDVTDLPPNRRQIGMVFQDYALFPHMTVAENIGFALRERGLKRGAIAARVNELIALVQLTGLETRYPSRLSGGQQQRVALARAIAHPPRVLLMDEPLSALDQKLRETVGKELREVQRSLGITTIFVTHDQSEAIGLSDTIAVMAEGRIVQRGTPRAIYDRPSTRYVAGFVGKINLLPATVRGEAAEWTALEVGGVILRARSAAQGAGSASLAVRPHQVSFDGGTNALPGVVLSTSFAGNTVRTSVRVADAEWLVETPPGHAVPAIGSAVTLGWSPDDTLVLWD
jgi:ABC-type Fe3+/spermidine/putrescine transport system ATPase subunit